MDDVARNAVIKHIQLSFTDTGAIEANVQIRALKEVKDANPGMGISEAKQLVKQAVAELAALGLGELIAKLSFDAGHAQGSRQANLAVNAPATDAALTPLRTALTNNKTSPNKKYTPRQLDDMNRVELIRYARTLGMDFNDLRRKNVDVLVAEILGKQSSMTYAERLGRG